MRLECKWCLSFSHTDRSELFNAVRGNDDWRDDVINNGQRVDDHDPDTISASIYVESIDELRDLLNATKGVRDAWGVVLHCLSTTEADVRVSATLSSKDSEFASDCGVTVMPPKEDHDDLYDMLAETHRIIGEAMSQRKYEVMKGPQE